MTAKQIQNLTGTPEKDIPQFITENGYFAVKFSPLANDDTCKIIVGKNEVLLTVSQMKKVVNTL